MEERETHLCFVSFSNLLQLCMKISYMCLRTSAWCLQSGKKQEDRNRIIKGSQYWTVLKNPFQKFLFKLSVVENTWKTFSSNLLLELMCVHFTNLEFCRLHLITGIRLSRSVSMVLAPTEPQQINVELHIHFQI